MSNRLDQICIYATANPWTNLLNTKCQLKLKRLINLKKSEW